MKRYLGFSALAVLVITIVVVANGIRNFKGSLTGFEEVPTVSTAASGEFKASLNDAETEITYELSYSDLEGTVQQAHIHFGQAGVNGAIELFLCTNLGNAPPSPPNPAIQPCPAPPATITGTLTAAHVVGQPAGPPAGQGIQPGEFAEVVKALRAGKTYANVHSTKFPGGEVRSQLGPGHSKGDH